MDARSSPALDLPALYRDILDGVAELERIGQRREAALVRASATQIYSVSWDDASRRRLEQLRRRIARIVAGDARPRRAARRSWRQWRLTPRSRVEA